MHRLNDLISYRTLPLTDPFVEAKLTSGDAIMLHLDDIEECGGLHRVYRARKNGWFINVQRQGKPVRRNLIGCVVTFIGGEASIYQFRAKVPRKSLDKVADRGKRETKKGSSHANGHNGLLQSPSAAARNARPAGS